MSQDHETYYLFLDESGDHGLSTLDPNFPVFVLCGVLISETKYIILRDKINALKYTLWGNKEVILHSSDIRKCEKEFKTLFDIEIKKYFYEQMDDIISNCDYSIISAAINKLDYINTYGKLGNDVYELCFSFVVERTVFYLDDLPVNKRLQIIIEKRGKKEDRKLMKHYDKLMSNGTGYVTAARLSYLGIKMNFRSKAKNINGLQLADLVAYPIARYVIDKTRANPSFEIVNKKIYKKSGKMYGLKIFP